MTPETFSSLIETLKLKAFTSVSSNLTEPDILRLLNDSYRSFIVPFCKGLRDEWNVAKADYVANTDSDSRISIPNSAASTIRTLSWNNGQYLVPLTRVEPENAFRYQQNATNIPLGFMLKGYQVVILPVQSASFEIHVAYMKRPPTGVLEDDAGRIVSHSTLALTLDTVPLAWQSSTPATVDLINDNAPFSPVAESVTVVSLVGSVLTLSGISASLVTNGFWVSDVGTSPFPNIPTELHPLLELDVICTLFGTMAGDKRAPAAVKTKQEMMVGMLKLMGPRTQGNTRPIVNYNSPGMSGRRFGGRWGGW